MRKMILTLMMAVGSCLLGADQKPSAQELAAVVTLAPYADVTAKVMQLGKLINNPLVPSLLLGAAQQEVMKKYGTFDANRPVRLMAYVEKANLDKVLAGKKNLDGLAKTFKMAVVLSPTMTRAAFLAAKAGTKDLPDGTLERAPGEGEKDSRYVKYAADGKMCAFAPSAVLAAQALADAAACAADAAYPLVGVDVTPGGFDGLSKVIKRLPEWDAATESKDGATRLAAAVKAFEKNQQALQLRLLGRFEKARFTADLDEGGLTFAYLLTPKAGAGAMSGSPLPAGALDVVPAGAPFYFAGNQRAMAQYENEQDFRRTMELASAVVSAAADELLEALELPKDHSFARAAVKAVEDVLRDIRYPGADSWAAGWLAFDARQHPVFESVAEGSEGAANQAVCDKAAASIADAAAKQWPGKTFVTRTEKGAYRCDWNLLVDQCQAQQKPDEDDPVTPEQFARAKKTLADVLGGSVSEYTCVPEGPTRMRARFAALGVTAAKAKHVTPSAALALAVPELGKNRPTVVFNLEIYTFIREVLMPVLARTLPADQATRVKTIGANLTPAKPNSALVGAAWRTETGLQRGMLRITAAEVMNYGTLFNTFTAASLMEQDDADDDDKE